MSASGLAGSPPQSPLAGGLLGTPANAGTIGDKFAGLLGQQGLQPQLGLSDTNNPTGDTESSPQELGIALPVLGTYIDNSNIPSKFAAANALSLDGNKKNLTPAQILQANQQNKVIPSGKALVADMASANEVSNDQEFQNLVKNLENMQLEDGKIKLDGIDAKNTTKNDHLMSKVAEQLKNAAHKQNSETDATATNNNAAIAEGDLIAKAEAKSDSSADLLGKFKTPEQKIGTKTDDKVDGVKFSLNDLNAANIKAQEVHTQAKELKFDAKVQANTAAEQVQVKIAQMVKDGVDMIRIKLHPEDLGKVDVQLDVDNSGKTSIRIIADKVETLDMLRKDSHSLERALKDTGVKTDAGGMQFSLRENNQQQQNFSGFSGGKYKTLATNISNDNISGISKEYNLSLGLGTDRVNILA